MDSFFLKAADRFILNDSPEQLTGIPFPCCNTGAPGLPIFLDRLPDTEDGFPFDIREKFDQL